MRYTLKNSWYIGYLDYSEQLLRISSWNCFKWNRFIITILTESLHCKPCNWQYLEALPYCKGSIQSCSSRIIYSTAGKVFLLFLPLIGMVSIPNAYMFFWWSGFKRCFIFIFITYHIWCQVQTMLLKSLYLTHSPRKIFPSPFAAYFYFLSVQLLFYKMAGKLG